MLAKRAVGVYWACPRAQTWLPRFFSRIIIANAIPKTWRKTKVIAIEKPGKDPRLAESYRPISLLAHATSYWNVSYSIESRLKSRNCLVPNKPDSGEIAAPANSLQH